MALGLVAALTPASPPANASKASQFQAVLNHAWASTLADHHKGVLMSKNITPGDAYLMRCSPTRLLESSRLSITPQRKALPRNFSLIAIDEADRIAVIASTSKDSYIGDNSIQPSLIRAGATLETDASTTYGHLDNTGYPYAAFGPAGRHLILLVNDGVVFGRRGISAVGGKVPSVFAGCAVSWNGLH